MKLREFRESDAEAVASLSNENSGFFQYSVVTPEFLKRLCNDSKYRMFVLEDDGLIGFCGINYHNALFAELGPICVRADQRNSGFGRLLAEAIFEFLSKGKVSRPPKVIIKVKSSNITAQAFFASLGFRKTGDILCGEAPAILMEHGLERP